MKKIIAILVALSLTISAFAGYRSIPNLRCWRYTSKTASLLYNTDYIGVVWDLEKLLFQVQDHSTDRTSHGTISKDMFVSTYSDVVVEIFNKYGCVAIGGDENGTYVTNWFYKLSNGQVYQRTSRLE